jgi:hypothetical protein
MCRIGRNAKLGITQSTGPWGVTGHLLGFPQHLSCPSEQNFNAGVGTDGGFAVEAYSRLPDYMQVRTAAGMKRRRAGAAVAPGFQNAVLCLVGFQVFSESNRACTQTRLKLTIAAR